MEYIAGGELSAYLASNGKIAEDMVKSIARQLLHALQYLHKRKITHRDIKPDNILISSVDPLRVKLSDFGLSKVVQEETFMKTFCGTLLYCAPEVYPEYDNYRQGVARKRRRLGDPYVPFIILILTAQLTFLDPHELLHTISLLICGHLGLCCSTFSAARRHTPVVETIGELRCFVLS